MKALRIIQFWLFLLFCSYLGMTPAPPAIIQTLSDKLLHAVGYLMLYLSCSIAYPLPSHVGRKLLGLLGYSILIEILQNSIPHRGFSLLDILANALGLLLGLGLSLLLGHYLRKHKTDNPDAN